jgi:RNA polymerase sigma factor for flagellar operon FliA
VLDELRRGDMLPRRVRQTARKIAATIKHLEGRGETATEETVASTLGVSVENYRENLATLLHVSTESVDGEGAPILVDQQPTAVEVTARHELLSRVRAALAKLETRDVTLLGLHYLEEMTFQEIGTTLEISATRVCQLLKRAIERLRAQIGDATMQEAAA